MELELDAADGHRIQSYSPGLLRVAGVEYSDNLIVAPDTIVTNWHPASIAEISMTDFEPVLELQPEVILFGTGHEQAFPGAALMAAIMQAGVGFEVMSTAAACRTFNVLAGEWRRVVAALII